MTQPIITQSGRDFELTPSGDLAVTHTLDKTQNATGNVIVHLGNDIFDILYGIDWSFIAKLGNGENAKSYIRAVVKEKFEEEGLDIITIDVTSYVPPIYTIRVEYRSPDGNIETIPLNFTV